MCARKRTAPRVRAKGVPRGPHLRALNAAYSGRRWPTVVAPLSGGAPTINSDHLLELALAPLDENAVGGAHATSLALTMRHART